jgi:hypothetical protein
MQDEKTPTTWTHPSLLQHFWIRRSFYGFGRSEKLIGEFAAQYDQSNIQVATKFAPFPIAPRRRRGQGV